MSSELERLTAGSRALYERARQFLPGGVTSSVKFFPPYPIYMRRAHGATLVDVDGREYVDYCLGFGTLVAGHGHPRVMAAIRAELDRAGTTLFGAPGELELALAERLCRLLPSADRIRFAGSGTEATLAALRLARAATGRTRIVKFEGHYHGGHESVLMNVDAPLPRRPSSSGIPDAVQQATLVLPFNDREALRTLEEEGDVAAVIVEPVARGVIQPDSVFLSDLRRVTAERGIVLVFDEVIAWPRVGLRGAQGLYGVVPDLTALGKAIGGGLPLAALAGRRDLMELLTPRQARGGTDAPYVFHGGTYNGTPVALAAGMAVLDLLEDASEFERLMSLGEWLRAGLRQVFAEADVPAQVIGRGAAADFYFTADPIRSSREIWASDLSRRRQIDTALLERGIYNAPVHRWHLSLAHTDADLDRSLEALREVLRTRPVAASESAAAVVPAGTLPPRT
jgi:glutamate-1-semialdehyde 2,1-aminomutase